MFPNMQKKLKLAIVTSYPPSKRTLNEYGFYLTNHFKQKTEDYSEILLLTDKLPEGQKFEFPAEGVKISAQEVWDFNKITNPLSILSAIRKFKPDVVLFNIQFLLC